MKSEVEPGCSYINHWQWLYCNAPEHLWYIDAKGVIFYCKRSCKT